MLSDLPLLSEDVMSAQVAAVTTMTRTEALEAARELSVLTGRSVLEELVGMQTQAIRGGST